MNELIKLTPAEQFLANTNISITLKEVANTYNKRHSHLTRDLKRMIADLSDDEIALLKFGQSFYMDEQNVKRITFELDLKTLVWFISKFDHSLRLQVINFAFEKLEQQKLLAVKEAKLPKMYSDGRAGVRRCLIESWTEDEQAPNESDLIDAMIWKGFMKTKAKATIIRVIPDELEGHIGVSKKRSMPTYNPDTVRSVWEEFVKAGKPVKSEYERLTDEFEQISEYYQQRLSELE